MVLSQEAQEDTCGNCRANHACHIGTHGVHEQVVAGVGLEALVVITNLNSILKSRDTSLPTKVHLVKAMVFPVVMYVCES